MVSFTEWERKRERHKKHIEHDGREILHTYVVYTFGSLCNCDCSAYIILEITIYWQIIKKLTLFY